MIEFKTKPFGHQLEAYNLMENKRNYALFCEMGTGKSKMLIDDAARLFKQKHIDLMFVLCPNGLQQNWILREIPIHLALDNYQIGFSRSGMGKKETTTWEALVSLKGEDLFKVLAVNIDQLVNFQMYTYYKSIIRDHETLLIVDESQRIKKPGMSTKRSHRTVLLGEHAIAKRIASGSPMPNGPQDLYNQFKFLNPGILGYRTFADFKVSHMEFAQIDVSNRPGIEKMVPKIMGYRRIKKLKEKMKPYTYAVRLRDCVDMPPLIFEDYFVTLTPQQERMYKSLQKEAIASIENPPSNLTNEELILWAFENPLVISKNALSKCIRLVQVLGGFVPDDDGVMHELDNNKIKVMNEIIEDEPHKKFMILAQYKPEIKAIVESLNKNFGKESVVEYHGGVKMTDRTIAVDRLQEDPKTRFFVAQWQSAIGITLTAATRALCYSFPYHNWEHFIQAIYRIFRIGQHHKVVVTQLVSENKADRGIIKNITEKGKAEANVIWDEDIPIEMFLDEHEELIVDPSELIFANWENEKYEQERI